MLIRSLLSILFFIGGIVSFGQSIQYNFLNYDIDQGLPSSQVYQIIQDRNGYIWFGTDMGLTRYNGYDFKQYNVTDGLASNNILYLSEDPAGRIWCYGSNQTLSYVSEGEVHSFLWNDTLAKIIDPNSVPLSILAHEDGIELYFACREQSSKLDKISLSLSGTVLATGENKAGVTIHENESFLNVSSIGSIDRNAGMDVFLKKENKIFESNLPTRGKTINRCSRSGEFIFLSIYKGLYRINKATGELNLFKSFNQIIIELEADEEGNIYVGLLADGLWKGSVSDSTEWEQMLPGKSVSSVTFDHNGGLWAGTLYTGLYYLSAERTKSLITKAPVTFITGDAENIFLSYDQSGISWIRNGKIELIKEFGSRPTLFLKYLKEENKVFHIGHGRHFFDPVKQKVTDLPDIGYGQLRDIIKVDSCFIGTGQSNRLYWIDSSFTSLLYSDTVETEGVIHCLSKYDDHRLLIGGNTGVSLYEKDIVQEFRPDIPFFRSNIFKINEISDSLRFFFSVNNGVGLLINDEDFVLLNSKNGLASDMVFWAHVNDEKLITGSGRGFSLLKRGEPIRNFTNKNGLISNTVTGVFTRNDTIWAATSKGISIIDLNTKVSDWIPIHLKKIIVGGRKIHSKHSTFDIGDSQSPVEIYFEGISFNHLGNLKYRYKLHGHDSQWVYTNDQFAVIPDLPAGEYDFLISVQLPDYSWSDPKKLASLIKRQPFLGSTLFYILMVTMIILLVWGCAFIWFRIKHRRIQKQFHILDLERQALQAQMNPHFIKNSLATLQGMILEKDKKLAVSFLVKFSRLTQLILNHSGATYVPLEQELQLLESYIQLEKMRAGHKFDYKLEVDSKLDTLFVAPMMIQPVIENAIKHGLSGKENGSLSITISRRTENSILCVVEDNGIGRDLGKTKVSSKGLSLLSNRAKLLLNEEALTIHDLYYDDGKQAGTKVEIILPVKRNNG